MVSEVRRVTVLGGDDRKGVEGELLGALVMILFLDMSTSPMGVFTPRISSELYSHEMCIFLLGIVLQYKVKINKSKNQTKPKTT